MGFLDFLFGKPKQELVEEIVRKEVQAKTQQAMQQARQEHMISVRANLEKTFRQKFEEAIAQGKITREKAEAGLRQATEEGVRAAMVGFDEGAEKAMREAIQKGVQEAMQEINEKSRRNR